MNAIANAFLAARRGGAPISLADQAATPLDRDAAYAIQAAVAAASGAVGGWKVGAAGPEAEPIFAPILAADIVADGTALGRPAGALVGIEIEIAFRLGRDLGPSDLEGGDPVDAFDAAHFVIEYLESRLERPTEASEGWKLADNQINGGLVIGGAIAGWRDIDVARQHVRLAFDGRTRLDEARANPGGHPFRLLRWGARQGSGHCGGFRAGQIVTTGSLTGADWVPAGTRVEAALPDLGVTVGLTA